MFYDISIKFDYTVIQKSNLITLHKSIQLIQKNIIETRQKTVWYSPYHIPLFITIVKLSEYKKAISIQPYQFRNIQILDLTFYHQHKTKSSDICKLINLTSLNLNYCYHPKIKSSDICKLINLTLLDLSGCNQIEMKSSNICKLINLISLNLRCCDQPEMKSSDICKLTNLTSLNLNHCYNPEMKSNDIKKNIPNIKIIE